jgi:nitrogen-specific signal transduction histidine kinase/CheY-like chemotaxis protein
VTFITDISEPKRLADHLRHAEKMQAIGTLAGGIAHEFNNILSIILGFADLTQYEVPQGSVPWRHMQEVLTAGRRAKNLVQQILAFSRQSEPMRTPVAFHLLLKETLLLLRASLPATIDMRQEVDQEVGTVLADAQQIHQLIMHLCSNAEYAMRDTGGVLEVCLEAVEVERHFASQHPPLQPGPHVCLTVRDTGHGMSHDVLERIFEPFFTTKSVGEGTGMGLAIVHGIVANHCGAIVVDSTPGQGTTCCIYLPRVQDGADGNQAELDRMSQDKTRVLFVDDEEMIVRLGQAMLKRLGYDVVTATSGREALQVFQCAPQHFDLVITDQTMPRVTGEDLAKALRQVRADIPIILCTGFSHRMDAGKAQAMGIDAFCMKPLTLQDLQRTIQQVLGTSIKTW